jgi:hypothetical protein
MPSSVMLLRVAFVRTPEDGILQLEEIPSEMN